VQACHKRKAQAIVLKLDFRKAFDSIAWDALDAILPAKGFPDLWWRWIHLLNISGQTAVVLNGVSVGGSAAKKAYERGIPSPPTSSSSWPTSFSR
jgi:hypothetical protein